jgi:NADPH:quinone reductase-like Zn-dependent oxidoreductase
MKMKAVVLKDKLMPLTVEAVDRPIPQRGEVRVKVVAAALNHRDLWIQKGQYAGLKFPIILGSDGSGVVEMVGEGVSEDLMGKNVIINPSIHWGADERVQSKQFKILGLPDHGTFAEYVVVPQENIFEMPAHLTHQEAAAIPLAGLTAWRALFTRAKCGIRNHVLITGIGGGVALFALQFALRAGATVYVTSGSDQKIQRALTMGTAGGVNYKEDDWHKKLLNQTDGFDVIVDSAAGEDFSKLIDLAKPGANIVFYGGTNGAITNISPQKVFWKQLNILGSTMGSNFDFQSMVGFIHQHQIKPVVDEVFPIEFAQKALQKMEHKEQFGKIVLQVEYS